MLAVMSVVSAGGASRRGDAATIYPLAMAILISRFPRARSCTLRSLILTMLTIVGALAFPAAPAGSTSFAPEDSVAAPVTWTS